MALYHMQRMILPSACLPRTKWHNLLHPRPRPSIDNHPWSLNHQLNPPEATCLCHFPNPIHRPRSFLQTLLHSRLSPHRLPSQLRILMSYPPIDLLHASWTNCTRTTVTLGIRSAGGENGGPRYHAPPRGPRFVWALSNPQATRGVMCLIRVFFFPFVFTDVASITSYTVF